MYGLPQQSLRFRLMATVSHTAIAFAVPEVSAEVIWIPANPSAALAGDLTDGMAPISVRQ
jgi:hypothetical protein